MGQDELSNRESWQVQSGKIALALESSFKNFFEGFLDSKKFIIRDKPKEFKNIYEKVKLSEKTQKEIYQPNREYRHGISIDFAIDNIITKKTLYVEVKRQDGWVENLPSSAGRGNAHERLCKLFTP